MVHHHFRNAYLPTVGHNIRTITRQHAKRGRGMGSVLLNTGGSGSGSSYPSLESYQSITGRQISGRGISSHIVSKLTSLIPPVPKKIKPKNINFSL